jgi:gamma-glutamyltranspeptidase/glutathione hydrolase
VCLALRAALRVCGMGPPSSGGIAVAQVLGMLQYLPLPLPAAVDGDGGVPDALAVHHVAEAERLAFADRDRYVADTDFVPLPHGLLDPAYLARRAALIHADRSMGTAAAGRPAGALDGSAGSADTTPDHGTSHVAIVDAAGNAVSMTSSVEQSLGALRVVRGFVLNNELTDFAAQGEVANRLQGGKRPRSSMAPTLVLDDDGVRVVTGSAGGPFIIPYVVKTLVGVLDWGLDAQQATALVDFGALNAPATFVGGEHPAVAAGGDLARDLVGGLRRRGHEVVLRPQVSGGATIVRVPGGWQGGVDPRREGLALGG